MASHRHEQKRHGKHQKHTRNFLKVYTPYLPLLMIVVIGLVLSLMSPPKSSKSVLPYATSMSIDQLLASTNADRAANHVAPLKLNSQLTTAAQNKANDMVARNYWSHVTPDGQQPWVFDINAGYKYQGIAENLAYGFDTAAYTVQGWMNSPDHRLNMLNSSYVDVGFGFKNSSNFVGTGPETVVVAEYGDPITSKVAAAIAAPSSPTTSNTVTSPSQKPSVASKKIPVLSAPPVANNASTVRTASAEEPPAQSVSRLSQIMGVNLTWIASIAITIASISAISLLLRHAYAMQKWLRRGEKYVLKHFVFDLTVISLIGLCVIVTQSVGFIR